jgi:integrase
LVDKNNLLDENAMPGPHDLRHYYASQAIRAGAALEDLTEQLGHDSIAVTLSHYYHLLGDKRDRVLKMAALIDSFNA